MVISSDALLRDDRRLALLLFLAALLLYAPGIYWGVPYATTAERIHAWGSDEIAPLGALAQVHAVAFHGGSKFDPRYPLLCYLIQAAFMAPYLIACLLTGGMRGFQPTYPYGLADPVSSLATMTVFARTSNLLMMAAVPVIAFATAKKLWNRETGVAAAIFAMVLYSHFFYSRTSNVDGAALFFTALGLFYFAAGLRHGLDTRRAVWLGLFAALATAAKDQSYAVFAGAGVVLLLRELAGRDPNRPRSGAPWKAVAAGLMVAVPVYALLSGFALNPAAFRMHVDFILHGSTPNAPTYFSTPATLAGYFHLVTTVGLHLVDSMGIPIAVAAVAGCVLAARTDRSALLFAAPILAVLLGVIVPVRFVLFRFMMPVAYILAIFAAWAVVSVWTHGSRPADTSVANRPSASTYQRLGRAAAIIIVGWALIRGSDLTYQMLRDSRLGLAEWLRENARAGDRLGYYGAIAKLPALEASIGITPGPHEKGVAPGTDFAWPEFLVLLPQQPFELEHERSLPVERYRELQRGDWNYDLVLFAQSPSLFRRRPVTWVNPPVRLYARRDVMPRLLDPRRVE